MIILSIIVIVAAIIQALLGVLTLSKRFDPLLPKERKKLPAKARNKARTLNGVSMLGAGVALLVLGLGILLYSNIMLVSASILMAILIIVVLYYGIKIEGKYLKK